MTNEEAVRLLEDMYIYRTKKPPVRYKSTKDALKVAIKELKERKTGKWVFVHPLQDDDCGGYMCSCCKSGSWEIDPATWKACPWCTALMEADE